MGPPEEGGGSLAPPLSENRGAPACDEVSPLDIEGRLQNSRDKGTFHLFPYLGLKSVKVNEKL